MQVILLEKVRNLGGLGDQVSVRPGYGRNYLVPQGKAVPATKDNVARFETQRAELEQRAAERAQAAQQTVEQLEGLGQVRIGAKTGDEGKLFGSVGPADVAQAITAAGVAVEKGNILMPEGPIRNVGEYTVGVLLHTDVEASVTLLVESE